MSNTKPDALSFHVTSLTEAQGVIERLQAETEALTEQKWALVRELAEAEKQREALEMARKALESERVMGKDTQGNYTVEVTPVRILTAIKAIDEAIAEQQGELVAHSVIAGAMFDFMGWLTSREQRLVLSSTDAASPAVEAITEFAKMRGLSLDGARVLDWSPIRAAPEATAPSQQIIRCASTVAGENSTERAKVELPYSFYAEKKLKESAPSQQDAPQRTWVGLTDEEHMILYTKADSGLHDWAMAIEAKLKEKNT